MKLIDTIRKEKYLVVDNILNQLHADDIEKKIFAEDFPFYYMNDSVTEGKLHVKDLDSIRKSPQFIHLLCGGGEIFSDNFSMMAGAVVDKVSEFFEKETLDITRAKINFKVSTFNTSEDTFSAPHIDTSTRHIAMIYYVHDTDGDTFIFDSDGNTVDRVSPKKNRILIFDGSIVHASGFPIRNDNRCVINYNAVNEELTK